MTIENLEIHRLTKEVQSQLGDDFAPEDSIKQGISEAMNRNATRMRLWKRQAKERHNKGKNPFPCFNAVCEDHAEGMDSCKKTYCCYDCLFQMKSSPPNSLNYTSNKNEKMPSHQEALDLLVENGLLKDEAWEHQLETRYLREEKKPTTQYNRGKVEIEGVTMDQFRVIVLQDLEEMFTEHETIIGKYTFPPSCKDFDFKDEGDREIFARNLCIGIEKIMGVYPNIQRLK